MSGIVPTSASQQVVSRFDGLWRIAGAAIRFAKVQGAQPSTWRGLVWILSSVGIAISPATSAAIIAAGAAVSGLIGVLAGPDATPDAGAE
jgi:hypothetical protein